MSIFVFCFFYLKKGKWYVTLKNFGERHAHGHVGGGQRELLPPLSLFLFLSFSSFSFSASLALTNLLTSVIFLRSAITLSSGSLVALASPNYFSSSLISGVSSKILRISSVTHSMSFLSFGSNSASMS